MLELQRLRDEHAAAVLAFEVANRAYFAASITDRGDDFYEHFADRFHAVLTEQQAGVSAFHVLLADAGAVVGRFNLYDLANGTGEVGYRVAEQLAGRGVATTTVHRLCRLAAEQYGLTMLTARTSISNVASQRVLEKTGFLAVAATAVAGREGVRYERHLDHRLSAAPA